VIEVKDMNNKTRCIDCNKPIGKFSLSFGLRCHRCYRRYIKELTLLRLKRGDYNKYKDDVIELYNKIMEDIENGRRIL